MHRLIVSFTLLLGLVLGIVSAGPVAAQNTVCKIPHNGDQDDNGIGDVDVKVNCEYTSLYAYDASGAYYWDLGDGRVYTSPGIGSPDDLDQDTLSTCYYHVNTRGKFQNDPYMDSGVIQNQIRCEGYDGHATYNYVIVSSDQPQYTGNPDWAVWGTWEYHVSTQSGDGNIVHTIEAHLNPES